MHLCSTRSTRTQQCTLTLHVCVRSFAVFCAFLWASVSTGRHSRGLSSSLAGPARHYAERRCGDVPVCASGRGLYVRWGPLRFTGKLQIAEASGDPTVSAERCVTVEPCATGAGIGCTVRGVRFYSGAFFTHFVPASYQAVSCSESYRKIGIVWEMTSGLCYRIPRHAWLTVDQFKPQSMRSPFPVRRLCFWYWCGFTMRPSSSIPKKFLVDLA